LQLESAVLSDTANFRLADFVPQELLPMSKTPERVRVTFTPKVAKVFSESLTVHSSAGDLVFPIYAQSTGQEILTGRPDSLHLSKEKSPYIVSGSLSAGKMTIEPGVTVLMKDSTTHLSVGTMIAEGTGEEPIIFDILDKRIPLKKAYSGVYFYNGRISHIIAQNLTGISFSGRSKNVGIYARDIFIDGMGLPNTNGLSADVLWDGATIDIERVTVRGCQTGFSFSNSDSTSKVNIRHITSVNNKTGVSLYHYEANGRVFPPENILENSLIAFNETGVAASAKLFKDSTLIRNVLFWENSIETQFSVWDEDYEGPIPLENVTRANPLLTSTPSYPLVLDPRSPCIDAGNPDSPLDPDGSRADIGGWTFVHNNRPAVVARLEPQDAELECDVDQEVLFDVLGDDPEEWTLDYLWLVDDSTFWGGSTLKWTFAESGEFLVAVQAFDGFNFSGTVDWLVRVAPLDGKAVDALPAEFAIHSVYPNPFNDLTTLRYTLPSAGVVELTVYDVQGRALLQNRDIRSAGGTVTRVLDFGDYPAGLYFLRMQYGGKVEYRKLVYIR